MESRERVKRHREAKRAAGLRQVQLWVPDTRDPAFIEECRRQSKIASESPEEKEIMEWIEAVSDRTGWV